MNKQLIQTDTFALKKRKLKIYRVTEPNSATLLWTSEQQAVGYVQKRHVEKLLVTRRYR